MPQAKHGARGVNSFAEIGSKLEGTGFEKVQIGQTHVASFAIFGGTVNRAGEADVVDAEILRWCCHDCLEGGFGIRVIFGDDFRNPALSRKS